MTSITCRFGYLGGVQLPSRPETWRFSGRDIAAVFASESRGDIQLALESGPDVSGESNSRAVDTFELHTALAQLTGNAKSGGPVSRIGILYAGEYKPFPQMLGIMFDRGATASETDQRLGQFAGVPREGCAVFVEAIARLRRDVPAADAEVQFTSVHELGHVFNLEHSQTSPNFMATSELEAPYGSSYFRFTDRHRRFLQRCSTQPCIAPGGSPYGDRAAIGESFDPAQAGNATARGALRNLALKIELTQNSFRYCEPVELEISLALPKRSSDRCRVPDRIDPGYGEFIVWIRDSGGELRRYKSPKFFCALPRLRSIEVAKPFRRDLSIFLQAGGYTFCRPGFYQVWATLRLSPRRILTSNAVECEVRSNTTDRSQWRTLEPLLRASAPLLYYRASRDLAHARELVERICAAAPRTAAAATARYALGRAHARYVFHTMHKNRKAHARYAMEQLKRAQGSNKLSTHSAYRAQEFLARVEEYACSRRIYLPKMARGRL